MSSAMLILAVDQMILVVPESQITNRECLVHIGEGGGFIKCQALGKLASCENNIASLV